MPEESEILLPPAAFALAARPGAVLTIAASDLASRLRVREVDVGGVPTGRWFVAEVAEHEVSPAGSAEAVVILGNHDAANMPIKREMARA